MIREWPLSIGRRSVLLIEGPAGWGECSPLAGYPCDPASARAAALEAATRGFPGARREEVRVNALVPDEVIVPERLTALAAAPAVKVKVGRAPLSEDLRRVAAVRDAIGAGPELRIDANGAWDVDTAVDALGALARCGVTLAEQPVATIDDLAVLRRRTSVALAADECVRSPLDAARLRRLDAADVLVLKVQPLGGVRGALAVAEAAGLPAVVSSMMETSVGLAAGLALACALDRAPAPCGLATLDAIAGDVVRSPLVPDRWCLRRRDVVPDPALLERYSVTS